MRKINERYAREEYDEHGILTKFRLEYPENYNFGYDIVDDIALNDPDRRAMVWCNPAGEERVFTFADIKKYSDKTALYLRSLGIGKGDKVLVCLMRHYQFWFVITALHKLGAVTVPATFMLTPHDVEYRINSADIKAVVCTARGDTAAAFEAVEDKCPTLETKIMVGGLREGWRDFDSEMEATEGTLERVDTKVTDPVLMYFSSGTSGYPKMVLHDHTYGLAHLLTAKHWHNIDPEGLHLTIADTGWGKAVWGKYYGAWMMEACIFVYDFDKFNAAEILTLIGKYKVTTLCCPPTMFRYFLLEGIENFDLSSLKYCSIAGEALNPDVFYKWYQATGIKLMEGFGQTETVLTICNVVGMEPRPGSMGKASPLTGLDIIDDNGNSCPPGVTGEIVVPLPDGKKPDGIMMCYYRDEQKTADAFRGGVYHTGDTAWRDEDGYVWYVGRNDDVLKCSGYRIGPFEIESVLVQHPAVLECAITGVPDPVRGQVVKATIVLHEGYEPSDALVKELQNYVKKETAPYKYPRIVEFVSELPKTINGKIRRVDIRKKDEEQ